MKKVKAYERVNFLIPHQTAQKLRKMVPAGQRSKLVTDAINEKLTTLKVKDMYQELLRVRGQMPKFSTEEIVQWIREDRESH